MPTPIIPGQIANAAAWTAASTGGKEGFVRTLTRGQLSACRELLDRLSAVATQDITRDAFRHPALDPLIADMREEVMRGKGAVILRGLDVGAWSRADCERIFWGVGAHFGYITVQSARGDRIGYVRDEPDDPVRRGYRSSGELVLHTDSRELIALMMLQPAESGGESSLASSATIHNVIARERPDLLAPLYRGYRYHSSESGFTECEIPVFSNVDGHLSVMFFESHIRRAAKTQGEPLPPDLDEAISYFARTANRDDVCVRFMLEPGEIMICNDFVVLHARTEFRNSAEKQRLLARLWFNVPEGGRPVVRELHVRSRFFDERFDPNLMKRA